MAQYVVQVRSKGNVSGIDITAATPEIAKRMAKRYGMPLSVSKKRASFGKRGLSQTDRYVFLIRLSTMLASKVGSAEALRLLRDSFKGKISVRGSKHAGARRARHGFADGAGRGHEEFFRPRSP